MTFVQDIKEICSKNKDKKIGMFLDMDGVIADFDSDGYIGISKNKPGVFLHKRPIKTVIKVLEQLIEIGNLDFYIISACLFKNQADDKSKWLDKYVPFIKNQNRYFLIREVAKYTIENKASLKVGYIRKAMNKDKLDICIYIEDEHEMLRQAKKDLKNKVIRYHISSLIE